MKRAVNDFNFDIFRARFDRLRNMKGNSGNKKAARGKPKSPSPSKSDSFNLDKLVVNSPTEPKADEVNTGNNELKISDDIQFDEEVVTLKNEKDEKVNPNGEGMPSIPKSILKNPDLEVKHGDVHDDVQDSAHVIDNSNDDQAKAPMSYANVVLTEKVKKVNFRPLTVDSCVEGIDLLLPKASVIEVNNRFANTLVGYFLGKRLAFPIVENYVKNAWMKYGIKRVMMNSSGFFFFKFDTKAGMEKVIEQGPWLIRSVPILLNIWSPSSALTKSEITKVPVWVKLHNVPLVAFTEDGLSMLATKIGKPIMLDSYTSTMCLESWGRSSYARALVELDSENELKKELVIGIPNLLGDGFSKQSIKVEYEWQPPRCSVCKVFGHSDDHCPKQVQQIQQVPTVSTDGDFITVNRRKGKGKSIQPEKQIDGIRLTKPRPQFVYRVKQPHSDKQKGGSLGTDGASTSKNKENQCQEVPLKNSYDLLAGNDAEVFLDDDSGKTSTSQATKQSDEYDSDVEEVYNETSEFMAHPEGASTPGHNVSNV